MKEKEDATIEAEIVQKNVEVKQTTPRGRSESKIFWGLLLVFVGMMFFLQEYLFIDIWNTFWPLLLVFIGLYLIIRSRK